jgi:hypothetical protein
MAGAFMKEARTPAAKNSKKGINFYAFFFAKSFSIKYLCASFDRTLIQYP